MYAVRLAAIACALVMSGVVREAAAAEAPKIEVHSLSFNGVRQVNVKDLRAALATRVSSRLPWGKDAFFDRARFEADLERIRAFYVDRGFPDARVTSFDVKLNKDNTKVDITLTISEGEPVRVTAIAFKDAEDVPPKRLEDLKKNAPLKEGQPLDRAALAATREMAVNELRDQGYPFARVSVETDRSPDPHAVAIVFDADAGTKAYFGPTEVTGLHEVNENLVRRELRYREGDLYRRSLVQESQRKLYDLELFQFVSLRPDRGEQRAANPPQGGEPRAVSPPQGAENQPRRVPMRVTVTESKHRHVQFSAGYGTEEKARVEGQFRQLNFLGGARTAGISAKWSSLDRGVRAQLTNPYFFAPNWSFQLNLERWYDNEPAFTSVASGGHATIAYRPDRQDTFSVTATAEYWSSEISNAALSDLKLRSDLIAWGLDPTTGVQSGTLNAIAFDARRTTAANLLNPTKGYLLGLHLERAVPWLRGTFSYSIVSVEGRHYLPVGHRLVVATRAQVGSLVPAGGINANVPFSKRYFLGGATSLRGWGRYELSSLSGSGLPIGGFSMFEGSIEGRMLVTGSLGLVAFLDLGNVWTNAWRLYLNDLRYDIGPGLRYHTPVGPLRVDLGYQLNPVPGLLVDGEPQTRRWRIHFSIGQAF